MQNVTYLERTQQTLIHTHHSSCIVKLSTVVRRAEQCHQLSLGEEFVPIFHDLMGSADEIHIML